MASFIRTGAKGSSRSGEPGILSARHREGRGAIAERGLQNAEALVVQEAKRQVERLDILGE